MRPQWLGGHWSPEIAQTCDSIWRSTSAPWDEQKCSHSGAPWSPEIVQTRASSWMFHRDYFTKVLAAIAARNVSSRFFHESPGSDRGSERFIEIFSRKSWQRSRLVVTPCRVQGDAGRPEIPSQSARDLEQECSHKGPRHVQAPPEIAQTQASSWRSLLIHRMSRSAATRAWCTLVPRDHRSDLPGAQPKFQRR